MSFTLIDVNTTRKTNKSHIDHTFATIISLAKFLEIFLAISKGVVFHATPSTDFPSGKVILIGVSGSSMSGVKVINQYEGCMTILLSSSSRFFLYSSHILFLSSTHAGNGPSGTGADFFLLGLALLGLGALLFFPLFSGFPLLIAFSGLLGGFVLGATLMVGCSGGGTEVMFECWRRTTKGTQGRREFSANFPKPNFTGPI